MSATDATEISFRFEVNHVILDSVGAGGKVRDESGVLCEVAWFHLDTPTPSL